MTEPNEESNTSPLNTSLTGLDVPIRSNETVPNNPEPPEMQSVSPTSNPETPLSTSQASRVNISPSKQNLQPSTSYRQIPKGKPSTSTKKSRISKDSPTTPISTLAFTPKRPSHPTIEIVNGFKDYGFWGCWKHVLRNLDITVYNGQIYTVLGPSGCGKSTLINVILGLVKLTSGTIKVFGFSPRENPSGILGMRVGYTPKQQGLYEDFTISETFHYYGNLLGLQKDYVSERITFLSNLLNIPTTERYIRNYAEGIKRQLSFAVAVFHEPDLIVLDEPCSGIDPVLRRSIWEHLKKLSHEDKTILVTTQSCDEARWSDKVGFMRSGQIIVEGNPNELLSKYEEKTIERLYCRAYISNPDKIPRLETPSFDANPQIVLEPLSFAGSEGFIFNEDSDLEQIQPRSRTASRDRRFFSCQKLEEYFLRYKRFHVLLKRDLLMSIRRLFLLLIFLFLPSIYLLVFCITIGSRPSDLPLGIVNYEDTNGDCAVPKLMSCRLLWNIDSSVIRQCLYSSYEEAYSAVRDLETWGILLISENCSDYIEKTIGGSKPKEQSSIDLETPFILMLDITSQIIAITIEDAVRDALKTMLDEVTGHMQTSLLDTESYFLEIREPIFGLESTTNLEYMAPGVILTITFHSVAFVLAVAVVKYRIECVTARNYLAGVQLHESVLGYMICFGIFSLLQTIIMFIILFTVFDVPNYGSILPILLVVLMQIGCGISFGIAVGMFSDTTVASGSKVFCSFIATAMICGIQWPLESLPLWLKYISICLPLTKSVQAVRTVLQRGTPINHPQVGLGIVVPLVWIIVFTICYACRNRVI